MKPRNTKNTKGTQAPESDCQNPPPNSGVITLNQICSAWNMKSWPTTFVLDRKGVIRYRNVRDGEMAQAVEALLKE